jgi:hypothetical protein
LTLGILDQNNACIRINVEPKTLVANFREPTIMATEVQVLSGSLAGGDGAPQRLGDVVPQAMRELHQTPLTGDEIFVTEGFREALASEQINVAGSRSLASDRINPRGPRAVTNAQLAALKLCIPGKSLAQPLRIGGIVSGLPQRRGLPFMALVASSSIFSAQTDSFQQVAFYTHPDNAEDLGRYLRQQGFGFPADDIQRMIAASVRFSSIGKLIWIVGGIMITAAFFFLFTCVGAFMEKNAKPNAVLRAYGLTRRNLRLQIFWRLGAIAAYALAVLAVGGVVLGGLLYFLFQSAGLPLPSQSDVAWIFAGALAATVVGIIIVVYLSVLLWWRKHESIAQELG